MYLPDWTLAMEGIASHVNVQEPLLKAVSGHCPSKLHSCHIYQEIKSHALLHRDKAPEPMQDYVINRLAGIHTMWAFVNLLFIACVFDAFMCAVVTFVYIHVTLSRK